MTESFGSTSAGLETTLYTLENQNGMRISVADYGATLVNVLVPDQAGRLTDVVLGYDDVSGYEAGDKFFGAIVGRVANRIGGASFKLNGKTYKLAANDHGNNLHSGMDFYSKRMWTVLEYGKDHIVLALESPDGDQGYPGKVTIRVSYTLTDDNEIKIHYHAVPEEDTLINMTNHSYFNLSGQDTGTVLNQEVWINADAYTEADAESIPTGEIVSVEGTPMDFRQKKTLGKDVDADYQALRFGGGYDHNWVLNGSGSRKAAEMSSADTGITMEVYTDLPGMQMYCGNFLEGDRGKGGASYEKRSAVCFETQYFPDAVHKDHFAGPVVKAGQVYDTETVYKFSQNHK